jgi:uncharacterized protein YjbI with pentapeptide repeats
VADFIRADLRGSRFERADLSGVQFYAVDLAGARFRGVDLSGAVMRGVELVGVNERNGTRAALPALCAAPGRDESRDRARANRPPKSFINGLVFTLKGLTLAG